MNTIYKYRIAETDVQLVNIPVGARILNVGLDPGGDLCLWALVDKSRDPLPRTINIYGTGHPLPDDMTNLVYLGSVTMQRTRLVWHVFENTGA